MLDEKSPIFEYYPTEYEFLYDEHGREYKNIALIPWVDEKRILDACASVNFEDCTRVEWNRNQFGQPFSCRFDPESEIHLRTPSGLMSFEQKRKSQDPNSVPLFGSISKLCCRVTLSVLPPAPDVAPSSCLLPNVKTPLEIPIALPTFDSVDHEFQESNDQRLRVFDRPSRHPSILALPARISVKDARPDHVASSLLDKMVFIDWPFHRLARVVGLTVQDRGCWKLSNRGKQVFTDIFRSGSNVWEWKEHFVTLKEHYLLKLGIDIGPTDAIVHVTPFESLQLNPQDRSIAQKFTHPHSAVRHVPLQCLSTRSPPPDARFIGKRSSQLEDHFEHGSSVVLIDGDRYGSVGTVVDIDTLSSSVLVRIDRPFCSSKSDKQREFAIRKLLRDRHESKDSYRAVGQIARELGVRSMTLSIVSGSVNVDVPEAIYDKFAELAGVTDPYGRRRKNRQPQLDFGLGMKYTSRNLELPGYSRYVEGENNDRGQWHFSPAAVAILKNYVRAFPDFFCGHRQTTVRKALRRLGAATCRCCRGRAGCQFRTRGGERSTGCVLC